MYTHRERGREREKYTLSLTHSHTHKDTHTHTHTNTPARSGERRRILPQSRRSRFPDLICRMCSLMCKKKSEHDSIKRKRSRERKRYTTGKREKNLGNRKKISKKNRTLPSERICSVQLSTGTATNLAVWRGCDETAPV